MLPIQMGFSPRFARACEAVLWIALAGYVLLGVSALPFHADEAGHIHASRLTTESLANGDLETLTHVADPNWESFDIHEAFYALTVAPFHTYIMGGALYAAGLREPDTGRGWTWEVDYEENVKRGHRPAERWLAIARASSTFFLVLSAVALFFLARTVAGRGVAIGATALYALSPAILLHGRRAMLEGPFLFFALLTLWLAARLVKRRVRGDSISAGGWIGLAVASGVAVATKHTAVLFVAVAFAWVAYAEVVSTSGRETVRSASRLAGAGLAAIAIFGILSPVLWANPLEGLTTISRMREDVLRVQVNYYGRGEMPSAAERVATLVRAPFDAPLEAGAVPEEDRGYEDSAWSGLRLPAPVAWGATILAGLGLATAIARARRPGPEAVLYWGLLAWSLACIGLALVNPIAWQRYLVPSLPLAYLLAALGVSGIAEWSRSLRNARA